MSFIWTPGTGPCEASLASMRKAAPKPDAPMGEAWFMGETRKMYTRLSDDLDKVPTRYLQHALFEIASGASSFGLYEEWEVWFRYLLPRLVPRCDERYVNWLVEDLCTGFLQVELAVSARGDEVFDREMILKTLGRVIMSKSRWKDGRIIVGKVLHPSNDNPARRWGWENVSGDLAASLIVCLRLIEDEQVSGWVDSIFSIDCPYWRAQLLTWHVGARAQFNGKVLFPGQYDDWTPKISWNGSFLVRSTQGTAIVADSFLPETRAEIFWEAFEGHLARADLGNWKQEILDVPALRSEVGRLIQNFEIN